MDTFLLQYQNALLHKSRLLQTYSSQFGDERDLSPIQHLMDELGLQLEHE